MLHKITLNFLYYKFNNNNKFNLYSAFPKLKDTS